MSEVDVLVVGAGAVGLATAWRAAERGLRVRVVERTAPGAGATHAAAGLLSPSDPDQWLPPLRAINFAATASWPRFADELAAAAETDPGFRRSGSLRLARTARELERLAPIAAALAAEAIEHELLDERECVIEEPGLRGVRGGLLTPADAQVDVEMLLAALVAAAERAGAALTPGVEPVAACLNGTGTLEGVMLSDGSTQPAALTVIATGAWSSAVGWLPRELRPPVRPTAGEYLILNGGVETPVCHRILRARETIVVPRSRGQYWVGTTVRESGYDTLPRADAVRTILRDVTALLPGLGELAVTHVGVGLRPSSADGHPIVGPTSLPGLAIATGHGREGINHAPLTAEAVLAVAQGAEMPTLFEPFMPGRLGL